MERPMIVYEELKQRLTANEKAVDNLKEALNIDNLIKDIAADRKSVV